MKYSFSIARKVLILNTPQIGQSGISEPILLSPHFLHFLEFALRCCHSAWQMQQCTHNWSDNLQFPYTSKLEVILWDQTISNFLVYNLQLPDITSNFLMVATVMVVMVVKLVMVKDGTGHLNLTFQVTCDWKLSQFLRCFVYIGLAWQGNEMA